MNGALNQQINGNDKWCLTPFPWEYHFPWQPHFPIGNGSMSAVQQGAPPDGLAAGELGRWTS